jgi:hypothetical protein
MKLAYSIRRAAVVVGVLALVSITAVAQENPSEISIQGTGFFTKDKAPSFNLAGLNTDSWTKIAKPSAGIVFRF